jgi:hypothetical protein
VLLSYITSVLKKQGRARQQAAEAFEEDDFVEDEFDDVDGLSPSASESAPFSGRADAGLSQEERFAQRLPTVLESLKGSRFALRSFEPSFRSVINLLQLTTPETVDTSLHVLATWRSRGLPPFPADALVKKLVKFNQPSTLLSLLQDRTKYGVELQDVRGLDSLFVQLSKIGQAEKEDVELVRPALEQAKQLVSIVKFFLPDSVDPVGLVATLSPALLLANSPSATPADKEAAKALLAEARQFAPEEVETVVLDEVRSSKVRKLLASRVLVIRKELEKLGGEEESLKWIKRVESGLAKLMPKEK